MQENRLDSAESAVRQRQSGRFRISAASRMSGVSTHAIRKWEERYGLVAPARSSGGERRYSFEEIERLALCAKLSRAGYELAGLAEQPTEALRQLLEQLPSSVPPSASANATPAPGVPAPGVPPLGMEVRGEEPRVTQARAMSPTTERKPRVMFFGSALGRPSPSALDLIDAIWSGAMTLEQESLLAREGAIDVVVVGVDSLHQEVVEEIQRVSKRAPSIMMLVVYQFGLAGYVEELGDQGISALRGPLSSSDVQRFALGLAAEQRARAEQVAMHP